MTNCSTRFRRIETALRESRATNTWRAYSADWRAWSAWAASYELAVIPAVPVDLARYLVDQAQHRAIGTLTRRLSAISKAAGKWLTRSA